MIHNKIKTKEGLKQLSQELEVVEIKISIIRERIRSTICLTNTKTQILKRSLILTQILGR